ncbi:DinB family protein [Gordonia sp. HY285]|uniref:DinB family protein n=1 Tax=Gordonia liuliyuniae TaxID=2911517 RepID=UPI001F36E870|nr:DinB family protein [Gordonia liuliyuniae]MCF8609003.1 DinB family protein [Gordonia liuliyuniae]
MAGTYTPVTVDLDVDAERTDLLTLLRDQRALLRITARGLTDEQARTASTVSALTVGGLIKHVSRVERDMTSQIIERDENAELDMEELGDAYILRADETLAECLEGYERSADEFDRLIAGINSLDELIPQARAPWQPELTWWSVRKLVLHLLRETAHHCGHADIVRESIDGQTTMAALFEN